MKEKMKKFFYTVMSCFVIAGLLYSCNESESNLGQIFDPTQPIVITTFFPDSGGIATGMILEGTNFGSDTTGLRVLFVDQYGTRHRAGLVSSTGNQIYAFVPRMTGLRRMDVVVEREYGGRLFYRDAGHPFYYITQTAVTTVAGVPYAGTVLATAGGTLGTAVFSSPNSLVVDDEDNIIVVERGWGAQGLGGHGVVGGGSNISVIDQRLGEVRVLVQNGATSNAPAFSAIAGFETVNVPHDGGGSFYQLPRVLGYSPRRMSLSEHPRVALYRQNWIYSFVANTENNLIYSMVWNGHLIRFDPRIREVEIIANNILPGVPGETAMLNAQGETGTNAYLAFCPINPTLLYIAMEDYNMIARIDVSPEALYGLDPAYIKPEWFAGRGHIDGPVHGRGFQDGLLLEARFFAPKQLAFTSDGRLYIADTRNHVIRVIDTTVPLDRATVSTAVGIPGVPGFRDGGPEVARFNAPTGVAVSADGTAIYVADARNAVIRRLAIQ